MEHFHIPKKNGNAPDDAVRPKAGRTAKWLSRLQIFEVLGTVHELLDPPAEGYVAERLAVGPAVQAGSLEVLQQAVLFLRQVHSHLFDANGHIGELRNISRIAAQLAVRLDLALTEICWGALV